METGLKGGSCINLLHCKIFLQCMFWAWLSVYCPKLTNPEPFLAQVKQVSDQTDKSNRYFNSEELGSKLNIWSTFVVKRFSQNHFLFLTNQIKCIPYFRPSQSENR